MIRIVTVPLDLTTDADRAIGPATVLARQLGAALEFAVVSSPGLDPSTDTYELQTRAEQVAGLATSTLVLADDDPVHALTALAADTERLVCMGSHGGRLREVVSPSAALSLVHAAHRPVVAVGPHQQWWPGPVGCLYVGVDEQGVPESTLALVDGWASAFDATICLVHAQAPDQRDAIASPGALSLTDAQAWFAERDRHAPVRWVVGDPAMMLTDTTDRANRQSPLLVVTTRVDTRRERVLRGSVARRLIPIITVPVVIVPAITTSADTREHASLAVGEQRPDA